jgi:membrane-associated phospholipid phosphatase
MFQPIIDFLWGTDPIVAIQQFFGAQWSWLFNTLTLLGAHESVALVVALALWLKGRRLAYAVLGVVALAMAVDLLLWQIVAHPRPAGPQVIVRGTSPVSSFPSGHTVVATCVWGLLALYNRFPKVLVLLIVLAVMLSRLYLGMHYLGDVLAGALLGFILLAIFAQLWAVVRDWFAKRPFWFFMALGIGAPLAVLPFTLFLASPRVWVAFGAALGAGLGLPLEYRYVRYTPVDGSLGRQALKVLIGLGVLGVIMFVSSRARAGGPLFDALVVALAALWLALGAPSLFAWLGLARDASPAHIFQPGTLPEK